MNNKRFELILKILKPTTMDSIKIFEIQEPITMEFKKF